MYLPASNINCSNPNSSLAVSAMALSSANRNMVFSNNCDVNQRLKQHLYLELITQNTFKENIT